MITSIAQEFVRLFNRQPRLFRAPGRVNLIGEHTDYNDGFVMPAAIQFATFTAAAPREDRTVRAFSANLGEWIDFSLDNANPTPPRTWQDYVQGVALTIEKAGHRLSGVDLLIRSNVPLGAGLSSSAALEVATAKALLGASRIDLPPLEIARLCQRAEVEFVGMRCGIMDQFASCFGEDGQALLLDCRSLDHEQLPLPEGVSLVVANTMVKHELAGSAYNERRADCEKAARMAGVPALRDLEPGDIGRWLPRWPERVARRARHVITENARAMQAAEALRAGHLHDFGQAMYASHASLRDDYEVSCRELDLMVDLARNAPGVYGSRMTGGGFGGCTISLVHHDSVEALRTRLIEGYKAATGRDAAIFVCRAVAGASEERAGVSFLADGPHRRFNALTGDWVIVSPHRTKRPWQGQVERLPHVKPIEYDPACYLCPGNERAGGHRNPVYQSTFVFDNDFAALLPDSAPFAVNSGLLRARSERGLCRVLCFSPHHGLTVSRMTDDALSLVVADWGAQFRELGAIDFVRAVQIFENRGEMMGASNPHPHCQIWAVESIPFEHARELEMQSAHRAKHGSCLLCDYLAQEIHEAERIVCENDSFVALVPFWAVWPFETLVLPRRHMSAIDELTASERHGLANIMRRLTTRYDNLFESPFPYSMGFHQRPTDSGDYPNVHLHAHYYPPLLRSATVRKFMVGFEMLGGPARDITPESAAERLRAVGELHYLDQPESTAL